MAGVIVLKPGMLTTVQDRGRWGLQASGVPVAGPMDPLSHRVANRLCGNDDARATLEVTVIGPDLQFDDEAVVAVAGGEFQPRLDGAAVDTRGPIEVKAGARLSLGARVRGARAYVAVSGGFDVEPVLASRATSLIARMGPFGGRALAAGDHLPLAGNRARRIDQLRDALRVGRPHMVLPDGGARLRVMWGPQDHLFTDGARDALTSGRYIVTPQSNRMGYRLEGQALAHRGSADILSDATPLGTLQVPGSGLPILLMADRQTAGGYPKIATVITADLPMAGQLVPGDWITFEPCDRSDAAAALEAQEGVLDAPG